MVSVGLDGDEQPLRSSLRSALLEVQSYDSVYTAVTGPSRLSSSGPVAGVHDVPAAPTGLASAVLNLKGIAGLARWMLLCMTLEANLNAGEHAAATDWEHVTI